MNSRKVLPMSERLQVIRFLIWDVGIKSTLKLIFLTEIIYGAKGSINKLVNSRRPYDFCSRLLKTSNYSVQNERSKKDVIDILSALKNKGFITINGLDIQIVSNYENTIKLTYLPDQLPIKLTPFVDMTNESFLEEIIKYAKDY